MPGRLRLLVADLHADARCETPRILASPRPEGLGRALLHVPCTHGGTQAANDETLHAWDDGTWRELDVRSWRREFLARVPRDRSIARGVYPDYGTMTVRSPLWGPGDADCCASHGAIEADLGWSGDRLTVRAVRVAEGSGAPPGAAPGSAAASPPHAAASGRGQDRTGGVLPALARLPDPEALARHPAVRDALVRSLGKRLAHDVTERLGGPSEGTSVVADRWVVGSACMPHACSVEETFLAFDARTGAVFVAVLRNGAPEILAPSRGAPWPQEIEGRVRDWNARAAGQLSFARNG
jgi:hypothetical protein